MASLSTPRRMALSCLVTVLVFAVLIGQTNGDIDVASSFTGAADLIKDAAGDAADHIKDKAGGIFAGGNVEVNNQGGDAASNANVNSASATAGTNEGFEEEEGTLGGDWHVIGH